jgi:hypothetical protein
MSYFNEHPYLYDASTAFVPEECYYFVACACNGFLKSLRRQRGKQSQFSTPKLVAVSSIERVDWLLSHRSSSNAGWLLEEGIVYAGMNGHIDVIEWLVRTEGRKLTPRLCSAAAANGQLKVLTWARENGCPWDESTCGFAAASGHLEVLKWARENGCSWNAWTCAEAARFGRLEVLQWAKEKGCLWNKYTCEYAAGFGHLEVLKWARENGCPW